MIFFIGRPSWSCQHERLCLADCQRLAVWYGLDQLSEVVEMFCPLLECVIRPAQLNDINMLTDSEGTHLQGLFR